MKKVIDLSLSPSPKLREERCISEQEARAIDLQTQKRLSEQTDEAEKAIKGNLIVLEAKRALLGE